MSDERPDATTNSSDLSREPIDTRDAEPVLAVFFAVCIYFTSVWQPLTFTDRIAKVAVEEILFTFLALCGVGLIASVAGPERVRPLILRVGSKAACADLVLVFGTALYILYCLVWS